ncbi:hypothetical protein DBL07_26000 [Achromobacter mucicolens]|uniref:hypothetical protein n=1 Tax=Achromobacter mucicolens TaxID=1389922 RepID=UPI000D4E54A4|nr:hypothetical protein [Achromobacter mucicolens]MCU6618001.1 hypothetical protein [Achromobacter mucicolens]PTW84026.1 hypothetical protein DBL07_26000 [Achromobacter mucicolens]
MAAKNACDAVAKDPSIVGGVNIDIDVALSSASQTSSGHSSTASGAAISAGRDMTIIFSGKAINPASSFPDLTLPRATTWRWMCKAKFSASRGSAK